MNLEKTYPQVQTAQSALFNHALYKEVNTIQRLRWFMEDHVFAVWDFMSLTKRLQRELTCTDLPWMPKPDAALSRFINEIVWAEESDIDSNGRAMSHLQMYLAGMEEVGADTSKFTRFLANLDKGQAVGQALHGSGAPFYVQSFVGRTVTRVLNGKPVEVAADFLYGREDTIPEMFMRLLATWGKDASETSTFSYYLQRHVDLDGDEHGPAAKLMLNAMAGEDSDNWALAAAAAVEAIQSRIALWDGVLAKIHYLESKERDVGEDAIPLAPVNDGRNQKPWLQCQELLFQMSPCISCIEGTIVKTFFNAKKTIRVFWMI